MAGADDRVMLAGHGKLQLMRIRAIEDGTGNAMFSKYGRGAKDQRENSPIREMHLRPPGNQPQGEPCDKDPGPFDFKLSRLRMWGRSALIRDDLPDPIGFICDIRAVEWHGPPPLLRKALRDIAVPGESSSNNRLGALVPTPRGRAMPADAEPANQAMRYACTHDVLSYASNCAGL